MSYSRLSSLAMILIIAILFFYWGMSKILLTHKFTDNSNNSNSTIKAKLSPNQIISFTRGSEGLSFLLGGWSEHAEEWGIWSDGSVAKISIPTPIKPGEDIFFKFCQLEVDFDLFINKKIPQQKINIWVDYEPYEKIVSTKATNNVLVINLENRALANDSVLIEFHISTAKSPSSLGLSDDIRLLSVGLKSIQYKQCQY